MREALGRFLFRWRNYLFPVIFVLLFVFVPTREPYGAWYFAGILLAALGVAVRLAVAGFHYVKRAGRDGEVHAEKLFTDGPFSLSRNPLYVGNVLIAAGFLCLLGQPWLVLVGTAVVIFAYQSIIAVEEKFLRGHFGESYEAYTRQVSRWVPAPAGLKNARFDNDFEWGRAIAMDYSTTGGVVIGLFAIHVRDTLGAGGTVTPQTWAGLAVVLAVMAFIRFLKKTGRLRSK